MNILVINCGSSSLKFQLIDMTTEAVQAKGLCERIGIDGSRIVYTPAGGTEDEVDARGEACVLEGQVEPLHDDFGRRRVGADVDAHMAHDAQEAKQDEGVGQQLQALCHARSLVGLFLLDGRGRQQRDGQAAHQGVDHEQGTPAQPEGGEGGGGGPGRYDGGEEGGDGLDKLSERQGRCQLVASYEVSHQGIERGLHDGIADAEQRERHEHHPVAVAEEGKL